MMTRQRTTSMGPELLKLLRGKTMSRRQIGEALGWSKSTVKKWTAEFEAYGLLDAEQGPRLAARAWGGRGPRIYTVAPAWRGQS